MYRVKIAHADKGIGFSAKNAIQIQGKQQHSNVLSVRLENPTSKSSTLIVVLKQDANDEYLRSLLMSSGRLPDKNLWKIESIERVTERMYQIELESVVQTLEKKAAELRLDNTRLQRKLEEASAHTVANPLEGLLSYFETIHARYKIAALVDEKRDLDFIREVLKGGDHSFVAYYNSVRGESFTEQEMVTLKAVNCTDAQHQLTILYAQIKTAQEELNYLTKLEQGADHSIPQSVLPRVIETIRSRDSGAIILRAEQQQREIQATLTKEEAVRQEYAKYAVVRDQIELLQGVSLPLPVIFYQTQDGTDIYFPVIARSVKAGFLNDLNADFALATACEVSLLDHKFVALKLAGHFEHAVNQITENVPFTLRITGYDRLIPYLISK